MITADVLNLMIDFGMFILAFITIIIVIIDVKK